MGIFKSTCHQSKLSSSFKDFVKQILPDFLPIFYWGRRSIRYYWVPKAHAIMLMRGKYEPSTIKWFRKFVLINRYDVFIDIGANVGLYSVMAANYKCDKIISFEPSQTYFRVLEKNLRWCDRAFCVNYGLGDQQISAFIERTDEPGSNFVGYSRSSCSEAAELVPLDFLVSERDLAGKKILIKIDVEGFEWNVIQGGVNFIKTYEPDIICEIDGDNLSRYFDRKVSDVVSQITELGYGVIRLADSHNYVFTKKHLAERSGI